MASLTYNDFRISGIAASVPPKVRETKEFIKDLGAEGVDKFIKTVGIQQGHICDENMTTADLCCHAANNLIDKLNINREEVDALIFVSQTPDYIAPSTACIMQSRLGLSMNCLAYDINLACSGFVYGISAALNYLANGKIRNVLLLCGDTVSKHCSPNDRGLTMLSTDAGTAILLEKSTESKSTASFLLRTIGSGYRSLIVPYGGYRHRMGNTERTLRQEGVYRNDYDGFMNGADVFKFSISEVPKLIKDFFEENKFSNQSFERCFLHQANLFIIKNIAKRIGVDPGLLPISIDRYGNTGAATIPLTICDFYSRDHYSCITEKIFVCGFGIGLSLGVGILDLENTIILPISICTDSFEDDIENLHHEVSGFLR